MLCDHALHSICIFTRFHAFRCVFICWKLCAVRFGLGWTHDAFFLHITCSCILHAYVPSSFLFVCTLLWLSILSLLRIVCVWHPSTNPLCLGTLFVLGHLLLILLLFISRFVMRRPISISRRTSPILVFIRNATWFYRTFPILLYPFSFIIRDGNLYVRYPWDVPLWSYKSSTTICTVSIPLYLSLLRRFKVHIS